MVFERIEYKVSYLKDIFKTGKNYQFYILSITLLLFFFIGLASISVSLEENLRFDALHQKTHLIEDQVRKSFSKFIQRETENNDFRIHDITSPYLGADGKWKVNLHYYQIDNGVLSILKSLPINVITIKEFIEDSIANKNIHFVLFSESDNKVICADSFFKVSYGDAFLEKDHQDGLLSKLSIEDVNIKLFVKEEKTASKNSFLTCYSIICFIVFTIFTSFFWIIVRRKEKSLELKTRIYLEFLEKISDLQKESSEKISHFIDLLLESHGPNNSGLTNSQKLKILESIKSSATFDQHLKNREVHYGKVSFGKLKEDLQVLCEYLFPKQRMQIRIEKNKHTTTIETDPIFLSIILLSLVDFSIYTSLENKKILTLYLSEKDNELGFSVQIAHKTIVINNIEHTYDKSNLVSNLSLYTGLHLNYQTFLALLAKLNGRLYIDNQETKRSKSHKICIPLKKIKEGAFPANVYPLKGKEL